MDVFPGQIQLEFATAGKGKTEDDGWVHRKRRPYAIVAQAVEGAYEISIAEDKPVKLSQGEAFLSPPGAPLAITHHCNSETGLFRMRWLHFDFKVLGAIGLASLYRFPPFVTLPWADKLGQIAENIAGLQERFGYGKPMPLAQAVKATQLSYEFLSCLLSYFEHCGSQVEFDPGMERFLPALSYMDQHMDLPLSVADFAEVVNLSVPRFHAEFKRLFNIAPMSYLKRVRLQKAGELLRSTDQTVNEIAMQTGFCSQFHLSREFQRFYGEAPTVYRKSLSSNIRLY